MPSLKPIELTVLDNGIHCTSCEQRIQAMLAKLAGLHEVKADHQTQHVRFSLDEDKSSLDQVIERLEFLGYRVSKEPALSLSKGN